MAKLTVEDIEKKVKAAGKPVLVEVGADWCPPCKELEKTLDSLFTEECEDGLSYGEMFTVLKYDATGREDTLKRLGIKSVPVLILYADGEEIDRMVGAGNKKALRKFLDIFEGVE